MKQIIYTRQDLIKVRRGILLWAKEDLEILFTRLIVKAVNLYNDNPDFKGNIRLACLEAIDSVIESELDEWNVLEYYYPKEARYDEALRLLLNDLVEALEYLKNKQ